MDQSRGRSERSIALRQILEERRQALSSALEREREAGRAVDSGDVALEDRGAEEFQRTTALELAEIDRAELAAIEAALARVEDGTYGVCTECGGEISEGRLEALPFAALCQGCQVLWEDELRAAAAGGVEPS